MIVLRPIRESDFEMFLQLVRSRGTGLTSLPQKRDLLYKKVVESIEIFSDEKVPIENKTYIFILENTKTRAVVGTCGILAKSQWPFPNYFYKVDREERQSPTNDHKCEIPVLKSIAYHEGATELCGLYLSSRWRKKGTGKLLSLSRFLFIAKYREKFTDEVVAEMRGSTTKSGLYLFWEKLGRTFYNVERGEALNIQLYNKELLPHLLPQHPIYILLLPQEIREALYEIHPKTKPALNMLFKQGFTLSGEVDIIDAGPKLVTKTDEIKAIKECQTVVIENIVGKDFGEMQHIISNERINFRACYGTVEQNSITQEVADALSVKVGDTIRFINSR